MTLDSESKATNWPELIGLKGEKRDFVQRTIARIDVLIAEHDDAKTELLRRMLAGSDAWQRNEMAGQLLADIRRELMYFLKHYTDPDG